ncbi:hypothetical protein [Rhizobium sp. WYJ-E13]|uniref:hypothetical protein n=1 Tax=unclassified Rhizobium TaxID=2613769 RepID=UPI0020A78B5C|nr:hypothetical protein [Rhizobium sp. WYJ-E13]
MRKGRSTGDDARRCLEGRFKRGIALLRTGIDKQDIERQCPRLQCSDGRHELRKHLPLERIAMRCGCTVIDCDNGNETGRRPDANDRAAQIGKRGLHPLHEAGVRLQMKIAEYRAPQTGEQQREHGLEAMVHETTY